MAAKKSKQFPHQWPDGTWHSIPAAQHQTNMNAGARTVTLDRPPPGSYDPILDQQERTGQRGYGESMDDLLRQGARATTDFTLGQQETGRQYEEGLSDLLKQRAETQQDYSTNLQTLARNYQRLGNVQGQRARQAGVIEGGGFAQQAAQKRATNQAIEKAPIDTSFNRFIEGSQIAEKRLGEARDRGIGQLGLNYQRGFEDIATGQQRTGTDLQGLLQDIAESRQAQYRKPLPTVTLPRKKIVPYSQVSVATGRGGFVPASQWRP